MNTFDIFDVFTLLGGLAFFLYGMSVMSSGLEKMAGGKLEQLLKKSTNNPIKSMMLGAGITIAIQSSSAMTVMLVGLVNSGIMQLRQTIGVIMGSNIGTTLTAWILSLAGLEGEHTVSVFYKTADAYTALLNTFTVKMPVIPSWGDDHTIITHQAFDALQRFSAGADAGYVFTPGQANSWNYVAECASSVDAIGYMGWVGIKGEIGQFGYSIDNGAYIFADEFTWETEQGIIDAAKTTGADTGSRFWVNIDLSVLEVGEHNIRVVYKNTAGEMVMLNEFKLVKLP